MDRAAQPNAEASELERLLLEAAQRDQIPPALSARIAEGIGVQLAGAAVHGTPSALGQLGTKPLFAKAGLWGTLSLALVGAMAGWHTARSAPHASRPAPAPRASAAPAETGGETALARSDVPVVDRAADIPAAPEAPRSEAPAKAVRAHAAATLQDDAALRAEVALLDAARKALRENASARALQLLDQHRRRFARATLAPEAEALRIEALVQQGAHDRAAALSEQFVRAYPAHPLSERVEQLVAPHATPARPN